MDGIIDTSVNLNSRFNCEVSMEKLLGAYKGRITRLERDKVKLIEARNRAESMSFEQCTRVDDLIRELSNNESFAKALMACLEELKDTVEKRLLFHTYSSSLQFTLFFFVSYIIM